MPASTTSPPRTRQPKHGALSTMTLSARLTGCAKSCAADQLDKQAEEQDRERERQANAADEPAEGLSREELTGKADVSRDDSAAAYDSAERRDVFAADMEKDGVDPEL